MSKFSIGTTRTGKAIIAETDAWKGEDYLEIFDGFTETEMFDALMALESFRFLKSRKRDKDFDWLNSLTLMIEYFSEKL